jgi:hypothetical protein
MIKVTSSDHGDGWMWVSADGLLQWIDYKVNGRAREGLGGAIAAMADFRPV